MTRTFTILSLFFLASVSFAQEKPKRSSGDEMIEKYLAAECDKLSAKFLDGAKTIDEWKEKRARLQREYLDMLGLWPLPEKTPLEPTVTKVHEAHGVIVENLHFQSKPGLYVTANLYRPKAHGRPSVGFGEKFPAIVYVCGHSGKGRDGNKTAFQDHGFWFANNGYVCIVLDTLELGEIPGAHLGTYGRPFRHLKSWGIDDPERSKNQNRFWWYSAGYTPAGVECWNGIRAIDYLLTRSEVDPERIGVTGISGGGAATFWIAAADARVKVAVPVSGMGDLQFYVKEKGVNSHCDCMFLYNTYQWDWTTIAALVAPRPMLFANSDRDIYFPMAPNRRIIAKLRQIYDMYGKPELLDEYVSAGSHDYRPDLRVPVFKFFNKHLKGDPAAVVEDSAKYTPIEGKRLRVFPTDADIPKDQVNMRVDEVFVPIATADLPAKEKFEEWKAERIQTLRQRIFRSIDAWQTKVGPIPAGKEEKRDSPIDGKPSWRPVFVTEPTIDVTGFPLQIRGSIEVLHVEGAKPVDQKKLAPWRKQNTWMLWPRGNGSIDAELAWTSASPGNYVERAHALIGQTPDSGRVWDILATIAHVRERNAGTPFTLIGDDQSGILACYAALLETPAKQSAIRDVVVIEPPKSHREGPHLVGILRVIDIPEALGLLAPRPLTIVGGNDAAFDRTAEIYRLAGAADKLTRK